MKCPGSLPKAGCYIKLFLALVFLLSFGAGFCKAGTYVSKENPQYAVFYNEVTPEDHTVSGCKNYSRENPDRILQCRSNPFFGLENSIIHYYWKGEIVDARMDEIAKTAFLQMTEQQNQTAKENAKSENVAEYVIIFFVVFGILGIVAYILWGYGQLTVFSSVADVLLTLILPAVVFFAGEVLINLILKTNASALGNNFAWGMLFTWIAINFIMAFSNNKNPFYGLLAFVGRIMMPIFIVFIFSWISNLVNNGRNKSFNGR